MATGLSLICENRLEPVTELGGISSFESVRRSEALQVGCVCVCVPVWIPMWPAEFALRVVQLQQRAVRRLVTSQFCLTREQADARKAGPESRTKKTVNRSER